MTEKQCAIYFGNKYININYNTEEEKNLIEQFAKKFNMEFNNLLLECGRANSRILLFFLLLKTQVEIIEYQTGRVDLNLAIKKISKFICEKNNKETLSQVEIDKDAIEAQLAVGNLIKDIELNEIKNTTINKPQLFTEEDIQNIINNIFNLFKEKIKKIH